MFNKKEAESQKKEIVGGFMNFLSFQAYPQVIKPKKGEEFEGLEAVGVSPDLPLFGDPAKNFGFVNVLPDSDGTVRNEPVVIEFDKAYYPSLDIATALAYTNASLDKVAVVFNQGGLSRINLGVRDGSHRSIGNGSDRFSRTDRNLPDLLHCRRGQA